MRISPGIFYFIIAITVLTSCRTTKPLASGNRSIGAPSMESGSPAARYIERYSGIAVDEMKRTGVPASITLAQGMLESDYGRSRLATLANNHFGIKCHNWNGKAIYHDDDRKNDCFRKYPGAAESFKDHSDFLASGSRYSFLFNLSPTDYKGWAHGLKKAGYATNPDYANLLIRKIEENNLEVFDKGYKTVNKAERQPALTVNIEPGIEPTAKTVSVSGVSSVTLASRVKENNRIKYVVVKDGDTREKLEKGLKLLTWELPKYNELDDNFSLVPGQILYLQPKREKAEAGRDFYITVEGDTMYAISQKYGIKLKSIYQMNRMEAGDELKPGSKIWLRSMKPVN